MQALGWVPLALLSAVFAALIPVVAKRGIENVDPTLATAVRAVIMAGMLVIATVALRKHVGVMAISRDALGWIALSGACGAASWFCYFLALRVGDASGVIALDRLSVVFGILLAALVLREHLTPAKLLGAALMVAGAILIARSR